MQEVLVSKGAVLIYVLLVVCLAWLAACSRPPEMPVRQAEEGIVLRRQLSLTGIDLLVLIDESGSMYGDRGTDPQGLRYEAGKYLVQNLLVKEAPPDAPHRIAVMHFGDVAQSQPFTDLVPANAEALTKSIPHAGKHLGDTSFIEALRQTQKVIADARPAKNRRDLILVIFTDGEPDDKRQLSLREYFQELHGFRQKHLGQAKFYVIGIDKTPNRVKWAKSQKFWDTEVGRENVFFITEMRELYAKYNEVVRRIFELPQVSPEVVTHEVAFEVPPYLEKLEFHVFPESAELQLGILKPDRTLVSLGDQGVTYQKGTGYDILTIARPPPGLWTYRIIKGRGHILVLRNPIPFKLSLLEPEDVHPVGKTLLLQARFINQTGQEISEHPDYPLAFTAKVITPKKAEIHLQFLPARKLGDVYYADTSIPVQTAGKYLVKLTVKGGTKFEATSTREVFVHSYPYLDVIQPAHLSRYPLSDNFPVELRLKRDEAPTHPEKEFENHPNVLMLAQLKQSPYGTESPAIWLNYSRERNVFHGVIPHAFRKAGQYTIAVKLAGTPRVSDRLRPPLIIEEVNFVVQPNALQEMLQWGRYVLIGLVIVVLGWGAALAVWLARSPRTLANIQVLHEGDILFDTYLNGGFLMPTSVSQADGKMWVRARDENSFYVIRGGLLSLCTFGLFARRKLVRRTEEADFDATRRIIVS